MTRLRKRVSERLKGAQNTYAMLSTFNEIDMTNIMEMRSQYKDLFLEKHGVKLGFMSAFVKASVFALKDIPAVNGVIEDDEIVYREYVDISFAVATPKGLVVPVLRNTDNMTFADVEKVCMELFFTVLVICRFKAFQNFGPSLVLLSSFTCTCISLSVYVASLP